MRQSIDGKEALVSYVRFCGQPVVITCDMKCHLAWGINSRPKMQLSAVDEDDYYLLADGEMLEPAPVDPGSYEYTDSKPREVPEEHNRWCARKCERSKIIDEGEPLTLRDFSRRNYNKLGRD